MSELIEWSGQKFLPFLYSYFSPSLTHSNSPSGLLEFCSQHHLWIGKTNECKRVTLKPNKSKNKLLGHIIIGITDN